MFRLPLRFVPVLFLQRFPACRLRLAAGTVSRWFGFVEKSKSKGQAIAAIADCEKNNKLISKKSVQVTLIYLLGASNLVPKSKFQKLGEIEVILSSYNSKYNGYHSFFFFFDFENVTSFKDLIFPNAWQNPWQVTQMKYPYQDN